MKNKKFNTKKATWGAQYGFSPAMEQGFQQGQIQQQQQVDPTQMFNPVQQSVINPPVQRKKRPFSISTPGTGDVIAAGIGIANALIPEQDQDPQYHIPQYGNYNPFSQGTGSQAIYEDGGQFPGGVNTRTRKSGGFTVTEEIPKNLGYGVEQPQPIQPIAPTLPTQQLTRSVSYEHLKTNNGDRPLLAPKFNGNWTPHDIKSYWGNIPTDIGGVEVLRGDAWNDVQPQNTYSGYAKNYKVPPFQEIAKFPKGHFGKFTGNMESGGKFSAGQTISLTDEEKTYYESKGYKFK